MTLFPCFDTVRRMTQQTTVYELRVSVAVPHVDGKAEFSEAEIVNRVDAALRYVPGNCEVEAFEDFPFVEKISK